jgi:hypothetical protein
MAEPAYLKDYIEVHDRITAFYAKYPNGSLRCKEWSVVEANGQTFFVYVAQALRDPDDAVPAEGIAWEPVPGLTPYTKLSEAMVAETSAWGRALAALGFEVKRGIASREEVMNRSEADGGAAEDEPPREGNLSAGAIPAGAPVGFVSKKQEAFFDRLLKKGGLTSNQVEAVNRYAESLPTARVSKAIDGLNDDDGRTVDATLEALVVEADKFAKAQPSMPYDESA